MYLIVIVCQKSILKIPTVLINNLNHRDEINIHKRVYKMILNYFIYNLLSISQSRMLRVRTSILAVLYIVVVFLQCSFYKKQQG